MKKLIYLLLLLIILPMVWSCENKDDDKNSNIPSGWTVNDDLSTLSKNAWYLHRSGKDSIRIEFIYYGHNINKGGMTYHHYKKNDKGGYSKVGNSYLHEANSIEKDGETVIFGQSKEEKDYNARYTLIDENSILFYNLPELESTEDIMDFKAVTSMKYSDKNVLRGRWNHVGEVDSTIIVFDDQTIRETQYAKGTSTIIASWEYPNYTAVVVESFVENKLIATKRNFEFENSKDDNCPYKISGDNLTIYWNSPKNTMTYRRIKN